MNELKGICVPICTPFDASGDAIDEGAFVKHLEKLLAAGVHSILTCGGTGEFAYLTEAERRRIHALTKKHLKGDVTLLTQISAISTRDTIENAKAAQDLGADALMVLPPYFEGPTMDGVMWHYEKVARAVKLPIVVYNIPQNTNRDITPDLFSRLLQIENIQYIKESSGDLTRTQQLIATGGKVFNGADALAFAGLAGGAVGCIWGGANAMPEESVNLYNLIKSGKYSEAILLWTRMLPAQIYYWTHDYNSAVKAAVNLLGGNVGACRKPALPLGATDLAALEVALSSLGKPLSKAA